MIATCLKVIVAVLLICGGYRLYGIALQFMNAASDESVLKGYAIVSCVGIIAAMSGAAIIRKMIRKLRGEEK